MDDLLVEFLTETNDSLAELDVALVRLESRPDDAETLSLIFRLVHTIKGTCGFLGLGRLERVAHAGENVLGRIRDGELSATPEIVSIVLRALDRVKLIVGALAATGAEPDGDDTPLIAELDGAAENRADAIVPPPGTPPAETTELARAAAAEPVSPPAAEPAAQTIRVAVDVLEHLMTLVSELVLTRNQLLQLARGQEGSAFTVPLQRLSQITTDLQEGVMKTRMQPIGNAWNKLPRLVRDLARDLGKRIELVMRGQETELDRQVLELIKDPLTHMVRNSGDHGLEMPEARRQAGKPETGRIMLDAYHEGGHIIIEIADDGRGLAVDRVRAKAMAQGLATEAELAGMTDEQIQRFIFRPGFSTAAAVTAVSGRGVGMDVVRSNTEKLGGHVELESQAGVGTTVLLRLPLTLAIIPSMIVGVGSHRFAIPQVNVVEFVWVKAAEVRSRIEQVQGALVLRLRDKLLPLVRLADVLNLERTFMHPTTGERLPDRRASLLDRRGTGDDERNDRRQDWHSDHNIVVLRLGNNAFGVIVDELYDIEEIVVKPLSGFIQGTKCFSGATILGDGRVIMILDVGGLATTAQLHFVDLQAQERKRAEEEAERAMLKASRRRSVILFKASPDEHFAVPQEKVQRLERLLPSDIQRIGEREFMDYCNEGLPLVRLDGHMDVRPIQSGVEELFVIIPKSTGSRTGHPPAGILISSILDAVDLETELKPSEIQGTGLLGSAMVNDHLTLFLDPDALVAAEVQRGGSR
jgi:two-component system chemotaxis sensor kinase CheA